MMLPFAGLAIAAALVGLGYLVLWTTKRPDTPRGIGAFGRVMAIVLMCVAGLVLLAGALTMPMRMLGHGGLRPCKGLAAMPFGGPGHREIRIEKRIGELTGEQEELMFDQMEEFISDSEEFEERVREIVEKMWEEE